MPPRYLDLLMTTRLSASASLSALGTSGMASASDALGEAIAADAGTPNPVDQVGHHLMRVPVLNGVAVYTLGGSASASAGVSLPVGQIQTGGNGYSFYTLTNGGLGAQTFAGLDAAMQHDTRAVTISASVDPTNMKAPAYNFDGSVEYDVYNNQMFVPVAHSRMPDGTMYGDIGIAYGSFNAIPQSDDLYAVNYTPQLSGTWGVNTTYNWFSSLESSGGTGPTFGNTYIKAQADTSVPPVIFPEDTNKTDHIHLTVVDSNDGAQGTANYYLALHQPMEFLQSKQASEDVTKEIEEIEVDAPKYATPGLSVNCKWNAPGAYWDYLGGGIGAMAEIPGVDEGFPWFGLFCVSAGIAVDHLKPVADTGGATFDPVQPGSTFPDEVLHPFATTNHALFKMYPHILGLYRRTHLLVDKWDTTGFVSETPIDSDVYVRGAGSFGNYVYSP